MTRKTAEVISVLVGTLEDIHKTGNDSQPLSMFIVPLLGAKPKAVEMSLGTSIQK
jgi:hypothetical protein